MITDSWAQQSASVGLWVAGATLSALRWVMISLSVSPRPSDPPPTQIPETLPDVADSTYAPTGSSRPSHTGPSSHEPPARSDSGMGSKGACQRFLWDRPFVCAGEFVFVFVFSFGRLVIRICVTSNSIPFPLASVVCYVWIYRRTCCIRNCYL